MSVGRSVRLFLVDGTPGGLLTAEIMNWTGHVTAAGRSDLGALLRRPEVMRTGVYFLLGDDPESPGEELAYVGEGDDVSKRLRIHATDREFWNRAVVLTSKDANLTKAHVRYLESRLIGLATEAGRVRLVNGTAPVPQQLPEADVSDMEYFIAQARIVLPVLGVNLLRSTTPTAGKPAGDSPVFVLTQPRDKVQGFAQEVDGEFTVRQGSRARLAWSGVEINATGLRKRLEEDGTLAASSDGLTMEFSKDHVFTSPSAAAAVLLGRSSNGRLEWRVQSTGASYGDWQAGQLDGVPSAAEEAIG
ncbi:MAG: GIY-YIG nuclease family protein [Actinobacteria bacterium]|nr:GIY-YIG nuclease family protein [Actinomycetota bacterium]